MAENTTRLTRNSFSVIVVDHDFAGFKKGDVLIKYKENDYYRVADGSFSAYHEDLLKHKAFDYILFKAAEGYLQARMSILRDLFTVWQNLNENYNDDYSAVSAYVQRVMRLYKKYIPDASVLGTDEKNTYPAGT